ncbi:nose resistant to fluoxetine protein 6-like [Diabrotica undecimpunctata]|uniref:nose resistant to fluoxetine protein 6-like n=1 Tax=Diabrotica undecimpunctata TaxID=50387 RepID=UPI003B63F729
MRNLWAILLIVEFWLGFCTSSDISIFPTLPVTVTNTSNLLCNKQSKEYLENLKNFTLWAYEMRDASAQSISSVLTGSSYSLGNQAECLASHSPFPTQYCLAIIIGNIPNTTINRDPLSLDFNSNENVLDKLYPYQDETKFPRNIAKMGWCFPASCSPDDAKQSLEGYLKDVDYSLKKENITFSAQVPSILCQRSDKQLKMDLVDLVFCALVTVLIILVSTSSYVDSPDEDDSQNKLYKFLQAFSVKRNIKDLSKIEATEKPLRIFYGMKAFSLIMILAGHRSALFTAAPQITLDYVEELYRTLWAAIIFHGDLFVDTFFLISGLLVTYGVLNNLNSGKKFNPIFLVISRYLRLTPLYAFCIFYQATLLYHTGNGPLWEPVLGQEREDCRNNWWTGILYVSNLIDSEHMCMVQSWYLACDFHFFVLALILIFILHKNTRCGLIATFICILATIYTTFSIIYIYQRPAFLRFLPNFLENPKASYDFNLTYIKSYTRGLPYFIGIIAGYIYIKYKTKDYEISQGRYYGILAIAYSLIAILLFSGKVFYNPYHKYNVLEASIYGSVHRLLWAVGNLAFLYGISFGPEGVLYKFFSWNVFVPLSKLTYGAFLVQISFQIRDIGLSVNPKKFDFFNVIGLIVLDAVYSFSLAFVLYLLVEQPFKKISRIILKLDNIKNIEVENKSV